MGGIVLVSLVFFFFIRARNMSKQINLALLEVRACFSWMTISVSQQVGVGQNCVGLHGSSTPQYKGSYTPESSNQVLSGTLENWTAYFQKKCQSFDSDVFIICSSYTLNHVVLFNFCLTGQDINLDMFYLLPVVSILCHFLLLNVIPLLSLDFKVQD